MMKWGRKKASSTSSHATLITHVFPTSWLSKFKQKKGSSESKSVKAKKDGQLYLDSSSSSSVARWKEGRFYGGDDDSYWRLSFGEESEKPKVGINSVWYNSDEGLGIPVSDSKSSKSEFALKFNDMVSEIRKSRDLQEKAEIPLGKDVFRRKKVDEETAMKTPKRKLAKHHKLRNQTNLEKKKTEKGSNEGEDIASKSPEKVILEVQPKSILHTGEGFWESKASNLRRQQRFSLSNCSIGTIEEECTLEALNLDESILFSEKEDEEISSQWKNLQDIKTKNMKSKSEQQRRSVYNKRDYQSKRMKSTSRVKSQFPRTTAKIDCKIKAIEDIRKARRMKKKTKDRAVEDSTTFDRYAVVKNSFNPLKDFRESMIEMIIENGIERPEELEELLACYLTLNPDEYHDLIVKVFRQVWSELNALFLAAVLQNDQSSDDHQLLTKC